MVIEQVDNNDCFNIGEYMLMATQLVQSSQVHSSGMRLEQANEM